MKLSARLKVAVVTSLIWTLGLSSCGSLKVKWWFLDGKEENALIRRARGGEIMERMTYQEADGYLCLSPLDVQALRDYCTEKPKP